MGILFESIQSAQAEVLFKPSAKLRCVQIWARMAGRRIWLSRHGQVDEFVATMDVVPRIKQAAKYYGRAEVAIKIRSMETWFWVDVESGRY